MNLSLLENRLIERLPDEYEGDICEEVSKFEMEISRMSEDEEKVGQATLTPHEVRRLKTTNQHGEEGLTVISWQAVKAYAIHYGVTDWTSHVDGTLSKRENISCLSKARVKFNARQ